jgi:histidinol phosphatase-like PHP family hydrolase
MSKGVLIFAYNSKLDYLSIATVAARLVKKHLGLPVAIVTDSASFEKVDQSVFDYRKLHPCLQ